MSRRFDLPQLADELLGAPSGGARTPSWRCSNPQHAQTGRTPPVSIFTSRWGEQRWRCHGCGAGGTAIDLVMACCGTDVRGALDMLAGRAGHAPRVEPDPSRHRPRSRAPAALVGCSDQASLDRYVRECADALFTPPARGLRRWLTEERGLTDEVLRANHIGADLGPRRQVRPEGMPKASGIVLPTFDEGHAVYAQLRVPNPGHDRPRYLNPRSSLAANPRLAMIRPPEVRHPEVIVTEGTIDALSAATAGFRSVALLSAAYPDSSVAHRLSRLPHPLVLALDNDDAGNAAADKLAAHLDAVHRHPARLVIPHGDINDALVDSSDWTSEMRLRVNAHRQSTTRYLPCPSVAGPIR